MALQRFSPVSPDPDIRVDSDMTMARFGHLNAVVDYVNTYVVADSLQLQGDGPLTSTARYITDAGGNLSSLAISTSRIGIGTNTPSAELHINGHVGFGYSLRISTDVPNGVAYAGLISDYVTGVEQYQYGGPGWGWPNWTTTRTGGTAAAPTAVPNNYGLNEYSFWGHDGTGSGQAYSMMTRASETWTPTGHGIYTTFNTTVNGSIAVTERMRFTGSGNITFNNASDTAKVSIKGSGSTSATISLLVQNSSGTNLFSIKDDGQILLYSPITYLYGVFSSSNANMRISATDGSASFGVITPNTSAQLDVASTTRGFLPPRMTTAQRTAIVSPAAGLIVYDTDTNKSYTFDGTTWQPHY